MPPTSSKPASSRPAEFDLGRTLDEIAHATDRVLDTLHELSDEDMRAASLLPGWTRGHVLSHLARNADGLVNLAAWASTGDETPMYPGGIEQRAADIEAGASLHAADHEGDIEAASERLLASFAAMPPDAFDRVVRMGSGREVAGWELPFTRIQELEIHHVDLRAAYTGENWSPAFTVRTLNDLARQFRARGDLPARTLRGSTSDQRWEVGASGPVITGSESALIMWLTGRSDGADLESDEDAPIPPAPRWL